MNSKFWKDLAERAAWTFGQAAAGVAIAAGGFGAEVWKAAAIAGGLSICKAFVAGQFGKPDSAALPETQK